MKSKFLSRNHTEGFVTAETAICCCAVIMIFALFLSITGYCRTYLTVREFIAEKAQESALAGYMLGFDVPGIITTDDFKGVKNSRIRNLFIYSESWGEEIRLNASYTHVSLLGDIRVRMSAFFTKWKGDIKETDTQVWDLAPIQRGKVLESLFGGGLPEFFPVLDAYDMISGHAASIVSIDTTLESYSDGREMKKIIMRKTDELSAFSYGEYEDVIITGKDIDSRELIIIMPENKLNEVQVDILDECMDNALKKSIFITIKRYQYNRNTVSGHELD